LEAVKNADVVVANSNLTRGINAEVYGIPKGRIKVVYPGANPEDVHANESIPSFLEGHEETPMLFFPKGTKQWWNPDTCLRALQKISSDFVAVFTGGTRREADLLKRGAEELGLRENLIYVDRLSDEDMSSTYTRSSVVVSIPTRQPFGLIPLEALLCGSPSVVSRESGVSEVLLDGEEVLTVDHRDPGELSEAVERLIADSGFRDEMVSRGRSKVMEKLTIDSFTNEVLQLARRTAP
jgi:glycosyltransferase involved in cell wall biosynthesis